MLESQYPNFISDILGSPYFHDVKLFLVLLSVVLFFTVIYLAYKLFELHQHEHHKFQHLQREYQEKKAVGETVLRWEAVINHLNSPNPADWKLAILEADTMLDEMLRGMGYPGETLGERLKLAQGQIENIDVAWEAHKVRNRIAHEGVQFALSQEEARKTLALFTKVFSEFHYF